MLTQTSTRRQFVTILGALGLPAGATATPPSRPRRLADACRRYRHATEAETAARRALDATPDDRDADAWAEHGAAAQEFHEARGLLLGLLRAEGRRYARVDGLLFVDCSTRHEHDHDPTQHSAHEIGDRVDIFPA